MVRDYALILCALFALTSVIAFALVLANFFLRFGLPHYVALIAQVGGGLGFIGLFLLRRPQ